MHVVIGRHFDMIDQNVMHRRVAVWKERADTREVKYPGTLRSSLFRTLIPYVLSTAFAKFHAMPMTNENSQNHAMHYNHFPLPLPFSSY